MTDGKKPSRWWDVNDVPLPFFAPPKKKSEKKTSRAWWDVWLPFFPPQKKDDKK